MFPPKPLPIPKVNRSLYPCCRRPLLDFRRWRFRLAADEQQWWEQRCPDCGQHYRFIRTADHFGYVQIAAFTDEGQGDRSLPVDSWLMALQIVREREAAA